MSDYRGYVDTPDRTLPDAVRTLRVLLYVWAGLTLLITIGFLMSQAVDAASLGALVWAVWPGVAAFFLARSITAGGNRRFWIIVVVGAFGVLGALAAIGAGEPRGVTQLILPIAVLVAVTRRTSRDFFRD